MSKFKQILVAKVLLILLAAGALSYVDYVSPLKLGLDLQGGTQLDYKIDLSEVAEADQSQLVEGVKEVIRRRVDSLGVSEPLIYTSVIGDEHHVIVELAGISNIEEAKDIVGKTIQLEFKEQNTDVSEDKVAEAKTQAQSFYGDLTAGGDFIVLATEVETELGKDNVFWVDQPLQEVSDYSDEMEAAVLGKPAGTILAPFEIKDGFTIVADGSMVALDGVAVVQIIARDTIEKDVTEEATVSARHILVAYKGAERSTQERSKSEAEARASDIKAKIDAGEKIVDLAPEWSDDTVSGQEGGDLGTFKPGEMTPEFETAAFALEPGQISEIIETPFGFHIIEVYGKTEAGTHKETVDRIQLNKIIYLTTPDPWKDAVLTGEHFKHADVAFNQAYQPYVAITFNDEGSQLFEELTKNNIGKPIAIFVGGTLISSPTVQDVIVGGSATISGNFTLEEAQDLARELNTGAIPAPIVLSGQNTISATLGAEALDQSLFAGLIGVGLLMLFMLAYYRLPGLLAALGLVFYSLVLVFFIKVAIPTVLAILIGLTIFAVLIHVILKGRDSSGDKFVSFLLACIVLFFITFVLANPITLTLAGIAGVVLSMGMAVDANVLIFERIK
ncbi:MAG: peptidylprolyl isomerase [Patescibacteria group bacterium]